ncbi:MAG: nucleotide exchange factor GrpE [Verrucomicrobiia bacterium]
MVVTPGESPQTEEPAPELTSVMADLEKFKDLALRSQADFENYRKRSAREREEAVRFANAGLIERLLPLLDNFDLGLAAAANEQGAATIVQGFEMVRRQFGDFLKAAGVEVIDAEPGELFDPARHEALAQEANAEIAEGHVIRQVRRGYRLHDRLLRAAAVFVSSGAGEDNKETHGG